MHEFKYLIRWLFIPLTHFKNDECGKYCLNKEELEIIDGILTNPKQYLMNDHESYRNLQCYYRDFNKNIVDEQCLSFEYFKENNDENKDENGSIMFQFVFCDLDLKNPNRNRMLKSPTWYGCVIDKQSSIDQFRKYCSKRFNVINDDYQNIFVCLILEGKVFHVFNINDKINDFDTNKYLICVYYSPLIDVRSIKVEMDESDQDDLVEQKERDTIYPYSETIDGFSYRWNYVDDIESMTGDQKENQPDDNINDNNTKPRIKKKKRNNIYYQ